MNHWMWNLFLICSLVTLSIVKADADQDDKQITFFQGNLDAFHGAIKGKIALVFFGMPWCGYCKQLTPKWLAVRRHFLTRQINPWRASHPVNQVQKKIAENDIPNKQFLYFAKVNCENSGELCDAQLLEGYPSVFLFKNGKRIEEYSGDQSIPALYQYILKKVQGFDPKARNSDLYVKLII